MSSLPTPPTVLAEIESSQARNRNYRETRDLVRAQAKKYLPLGASTSAGAALKGGPDLDAERMKDHVSHFVLRLAFCRTEDLRRRFVKAETMLFRLRFEDDDAAEKERFLRALKLDWEQVAPEEKYAHRDALVAANPRLASSVDTETFYKVRARASACWISRCMLVELTHSVIYAHHGRCTGHEYWTSWRRDGCTFTMERHGCLCENKRASSWLNSPIDSRKTSRCVS